MARKSRIRKIKRTTYYFQLSQLETRKASFSEEYKKNKHVYVEQFLRCSGSEQIDLVRTLMQSMSHFQLGAIDHTLQPLLQRDFITQLATEGLPDLAKCILGYLDSKSLRNAEMVNHQTFRL